MRHPAILIFSFLSANLLIASCISTARLKRENTSDTSNFLPTNITGLYSNNEINSKNNSRGLWGKMNESYSGKLKIYRAEDSSYVKLELLNETSLNVKLLNSKQKILDEFILKGKIEDKYFSIDRKLFILPIPFLFLHFETKSLIGCTKDGNLILLHGSANQGWILILAGGDQNISQCQFKKILNNDRE